MRNSKSNLSIILNQVKTRFRIVLTGTPLQNNLFECKPTNTHTHHNVSKHCNSKTLAAVYFILGLLIDLLLNNYHSKNESWNQCSSSVMMQQIFTFSS